MQQPLLIQDERPTSLGKAAISYIKSSKALTPALGFISSYDFTLNPYRGCSFACSYCYAAFFPRGEDKRESWGCWVEVRERAVDEIRKLTNRSLDGKTIYCSSLTDAFQPAERRLEITRGILQAMVERRDKPFLTVQTRSPLVTRDIDLFHTIIENGGKVQVNVTVTTDDDEIRRMFEPSCPSLAARLKAVKTVNDAGIQTCITVTPLIWVREPESFADTLLATGVQRFIAQPFHVKRTGLVYPSAATRDTAMQLMADRLDCDVDAVHAKHQLHYNRAVKVLKEKLPWLGEGREGFRPPW